MKQTSFTHQSNLDDLDYQEIEEEDDHSLCTIAIHLQETASYAIDLAFKERLYKELLRQFIEHYRPV